MNLIIQQLQEEYNILLLKDFSEYYISGADKIFDDIVTLRRKSFDDKDRIVFYDQTPGSSWFYNLLNKHLIELDIPDFFVFFIADNEHKSVISYNKSADNFKLTTKKTLPENFKPINIPDSVCVNPWINVEITHSGKLNICCLYSSKNLPKISDTSINDFYNGHMADIRKQFLAGETPEGCSKCSNLEAAGKTSKRMLDFYVYRDKKYKINWLNPEFDSDVVSLDLKVGNLCNLACRICNPGNSSLWANELNIDSQAQNNIWIYQDTDKKLDYLSELNLEYLQITGGEPLLNKEHLRYLQKLVNLGKSKNINLHYNSNGTVFPIHLLEIWKKFKSVEISLSIDNLYEKFNYERYGLVKWDTVEKNIQRFIELGDSIVLNIFSTVTVFNILDLKSIFDYFNGKNIPVTFNVLTTPKIYNIVWLPANIKDYICTKLLKNNEHDEQFIVAVKSIVNYMLSTELLDQVEAFLDATTKIDIRRNQKFGDVYTEMTFLLGNNYGKTI